MQRRRTTHPPKTINTPPPKMNTFQQCLDQKKVQYSVSGSSFYLPAEVNLEQILQTINGRYESTSEFAVAEKNTMDVYRITNPIETTDHGLKTSEIQVINYLERGRNQSLIDEKVGTDLVVKTELKIHAGYGVHSTLGENIALTIMEELLKQNIPATYITTIDLVRGRITAYHKKP